MSDQNELSENEFRELLRDLVHFFETYTATADLIRIASGPPRRFLESLVTMEVYLNSLSSNMLLSLYQFYSIEVEIIRRSLLEGHAKFMALILHPEGHEIADWQYNDCLILLHLESRKRSLAHQKSTIVRLPDWSYLPDQKEMMAASIEFELRELGKLILDRSKTSNPLTGVRLSEKYKVAVRKHWEVANLFINYTGFGRYPYSKAIKSYREASSISHFSAETLQRVPAPLRPTIKFVFRDEQIKELILDVMTLVADRQTFILNRLGLRPLPSTDLVNQFKRLALHGMHVYPPYLGYYKVVSVDGEIITIKPDD